MTIVLTLLLATAAADIPRLDPPEVHELVKKGQAVVVDVRGSVPYELGHVAGAVWIPLGFVARRAAELPADKLIVTYCTCKAEESSLEAARILASLGFERLAALRGGYPAWEKAGLPTEAIDAAERDAVDAPSAAGSAPGAASRLRPPAGVPCNRDFLTSYAGKVTGYRRGKGKTTVTIRTSAGTTETVTIAHPGSEDPSRWFLFESSPFTGQHWRRIEAAKGKLLKEMSAIGWVCQDGPSLVDWRPGTTFRGDE